ncbi:hypothetical protein L2E82_45324 [Cichorium intybus]|uniref:Uncharacterized protein n=1 Tax=Cichorium intybus TaxID=13427 RepID=A0ACB8ZRP4_CICIN|nr:hypothetical protein L2E82_45324 [Cichorium intybus]
MATGEKSHRRGTQENSTTPVDTRKNIPANSGFRSNDDRGITKGTKAVDINDEGDQEMGCKSIFNYSSGNNSREVRSLKAAHENNSNGGNAESGMPLDPPRPHPCGPIGCGPYPNELDKESHVMGRDGNLNAISKHLSAGCFGPFPSRAELRKECNNANMPS